MSAFSSESGSDPALPRPHARRLREVYRSTGWPARDAVEVDLLAAGLLERVVLAEGIAEAGEIPADCEQAALRDADATPPPDASCAGLAAPDVPDADPGTAV